MHTTTSGYTLPRHTSHPAPLPGITLLLVLGTNKDLTAHITKRLACDFHLTGLSVLQTLHSIRNAHLKGTDITDYVFPMHPDTFCEQVERGTLTSTEVVVRVMRKRVDELVQKEGKRGFVVCHFEERGRVLNEIVRGLASPDALLSLSPSFPSPTDEEWAIELNFCRRNRLITISPDPNDSLDEIYKDILSQLYRRVKGKRLRLMPPSQVSDIANRYAKDRIDVDGTDTGAASPGLVGTMDSEFAGSDLHVDEGVEVDVEMDGEGEGLDSSKRNEGANRPIFGPERPPLMQTK